MKVTAITVVALLCIVKFAILPALVRNWINASLQQHIDGNITIGSINVGLFGSTTASDVIVRDARGHNWLAVDSITIELSNWLILGPQINKVVVTGVLVSPLYVDGELVLPMRGKPMTLDEILDEVETGLLSDLTPRIEINKVRVRSVAKNTYEFSLTKKPTSAPDDTSREQMLQSAIALALRNASIDSVLVDDGKVTLANYHGWICSGLANANFAFLAHKNKPSLLTGTIRANNISLFTLSRSVFPHRTMRTGKARASVRIQMTGRRLGNLIGKGAIFIDDADLWQMPIFGDIFTQVGMPLQCGDAEAIFLLNGPVVTLQHGRVSNTLSAIDSDAGGTVNLQTTQMNLCVIPVPIKQTSDIMNKIPMLNKLSGIGSSLLKFRVKGSWNDDATKLVSKEPIANFSAISKSTRGFFSSAAKSGGQLAGDVFKALDDIADTNLH